MTPTEYDLSSGSLEIVGQISPASNQAFLCTLPGGRKCIYKPVAGESPLWDFPDGSLAFREYAAWMVSEELGWRIVPRTTLREGPLGLGMVQQWVEPAEDQLPVRVVTPDSVPANFLSVVQAMDERGTPVSLIHCDNMDLFRIAVFDVLTNNADRKGSHILVTGQLQYHGIDHGLCFHQHEKLRTVLWGWAGDEIPRFLLEDVERLLRGLAGDLAQELSQFLDPSELESLKERAMEMLASKRMPLLLGGWQALPWPPL